MPSRRCSGLSTRNSPPNDQKAWPPRLCSPSWSTTMTRFPASAISVAATRPANPPPTTIASASSAMMSAPHSPRLKPVALTTVNGKWYRSAPAGAVCEAPVCSSLGPPGARGHPACNTQFEFVLNQPAHLDKTPIPQHAGDASRKTLRFGFDGWTGAGHEVGDGVARGGSLAGGRGGEPGGGSHRGRSWRPDRHLRRQISGSAQLGRGRDHRWFVRLGLHHRSGRGSP